MTCDACMTRPTDAARRVCNECLNDLRDALRTVTGDRHTTSLVNDLMDAIAKQTRFTSGSGSKTAAGQEQPLPLNLHAGKKAHELRSALITAATTVHDHIRPRHERQRPTTDFIGPMPLDDVGIWDDFNGTAAGSARYLLAHTATIGAMETAGALINRVIAAVKAATRSTDRPADKIYLGPCDGRGILTDTAKPCYSGDIYGEVGKHKGHCRACTVTYDVTQRRDVMRSDVLTRMFTIDELPLAGDMIGRVITVDTVRAYVRSHRLLAAGQARAGKPMYSLAALLELIDAAPRDATPRLMATRRSA